MKAGRLRLEQLVYNEGIEAESWSSRSEMKVARLRAGAVGL